MVGLLVRVHVYVCMYICVHVHSCLPIQEIRFAWPDHVIHVIIAIDCSSFSPIRSKKVLASKLKLLQRVLNVFVYCMRWNIFLNCIKNGITLAMSIFIGLFKSDEHTVDSFLSENSCRFRPKYEKEHLINIALNDDKRLKFCRVVLV